MFLALLLLLPLKTFASPPVTITELYASKNAFPLGDWLELTNNTDKPILIEHLEMVFDKSPQKQEERLNVLLNTPLLLTDYLIISNQEWPFPFDSLVTQASFLIEPRMDITTRGPQEICIVINHLSTSCVQLPSRTRFIENHALFPYLAVQKLLNVEMCEILPGYFITPGFPPEYCVAKDYAEKKHVPPVLLSDKTIVIDDDAGQKKGFLISICQGDKKGICNALLSLRASEKEIKFEEKNWEQADLILVQNKWGITKELVVPKTQKFEPKLEAFSVDSHGLSLRLNIPDNLVPANFRIVDVDEMKTIQSGAFLEGGLKTIMLPGLTHYRRYQLHLLNSKNTSITNIYRPQ